LAIWTNEVAPGLRITDFTTCGPKNYSYTTENLATGAVRDILKVKGLRLSRQAADMLNSEVMQDQVDMFAVRDQHIEDEDIPLAKRICLVAVQKSKKDAHTKHLNKTFLLRGASACTSDEMVCEVVHGPCNCRKCSSKTSVTIPQVQFRKHRRDGYVETSDIRKEYKLVLQKRWLLREYHGCKLPFEYLTLPFGFKKLLKRPL
jgi:hypothetical protein